MNNDPTPAGEDCILASLERPSNYRLYYITNYNGGYDFLPSKNSELHAIFVEKSWALFVNLLLRYMVHAQTEPINMLAYSGKSLRDYAKYKIPS